MRNSLGPVSILLGLGLRVLFEDFSDFMRRIAGYLTSENGKEGRKKTQK